MLSWVATWCRGPGETLFHFTARHDASLAATPTLMSLFHVNILYKTFKSIVIIMNYYQSWLVSFWDHPHVINVFACTRAFVQWVQTDRMGSTAGLWDFWEISTHKHICGLSCQINSFHVQENNSKRDSVFKSFRMWKCSHSYQIYIHTEIKSVFVFKKMLILVNSY